MDSRVDLDIVGALENADKSSCVRLSWDYVRHYERELEDLRQAPINVIEIGVAGGSSMRIWRWFFPHASIVGVDIDPICVKHAGDRVKIETGSQVFAAFLDRVCTENPPTVVVDDGSHIMEHMIFTFEHMFPRLLPGGVYIIEDFHGFIGVDAAEAQAASGQNAPEYFLQVARCCFAKSMVRSTLIVPPAVISLVDSVQFIGRAVLIRKKHEERNVARALATADAYVQDRKLPVSAQENIVAYVLSHRGPNAVAEQRLRDIIAMHGPNMWRLVLMAELHLKNGADGEAEQLVEQAAALEPMGHGVLVRLARLQEKFSDLQGALKNAQAAAELRPKNGAYRQLIKRLQSLTKG